MVGGRPMGRWVRVLGGVVAVTLLGDGFSGTAFAQLAPPKPAGLNRVSSKDPEGIRKVLRDAIRDETRARDALLAENTEDAAKLIYSGYVKIRMAHEALHLRISHAKSPSSRLMESSKTIDQLRFHIL